MENNAIYKIKDLLPTQIKLAIDKLQTETVNRISEIRLRAGSVSTVTVFGENLYLNDTGISRNPARCIKTSASEINDFLYRFCDGSVYSFESSIKQGFITRYGIRAGICGNAIIKGAELCGFSEITGVNLRIPCHISGCADTIIKHISHGGLAGGAGILIASAPGVGKTTMLRELAIKLTRGIPADSINSVKVYRVSVIDERSEIYIPEFFSGCAVDVYGGIPKASGLEYAMRVMSPEIIMCDEIGSKRDAEIIGEAHLGGVTVIASVHAVSLKDILTKPAVKRLCDDGVFSHICMLSRKNGKVSSELCNYRELTKVC